MTAKVEEFKPDIEIVTRFRGLMSAALAGMDVGHEIDATLDEIKTLSVPDTEKALIQLAVAKMFYNLAVSRAHERDESFGVIWGEAMKHIDAALRHLQDVCGKRADVPERTVH